MNYKIALFFAVALFVVVAEVSGRSIIEKKVKLVGLKDHEYDGCSCSERVVKSKDVKRYPLKLPLECHRPGDTCRCRKVKVTPAILPRPKYYKHIEKVESCGKYIKAPQYMHDFSDVEDYSAEDEYVKVPVDDVSLHIAQELQRAIETKQTEEALSFGFRTIPADRPTQKYRKNVPEGDLLAYEKTIVELQPFKVQSCDSDEATFQQDVKQPISLPSFQDVGYLPVTVGKSPKFVKKTCVVDDGSHESVEVVKKVVQKKVVSPKKVIVDDYSEEDYKYPTKKVVVDDYSEEDYKYPTKKVVVEESEEDYQKVYPTKKFLDDSYEVDYKKKPVDSYEVSEEYVKKVPVYEDDSVEYKKEPSYSEEDFYAQENNNSYDENTDGFYDELGGDEGMAKKVYKN